jgi:RNA polymerase sigma factor (sigma-70 family)
LVQYIKRLVVQPEWEEAADANLLERFISAKDEKAFAALVDRHGPLVLQVCRRVLGDVQDAEDAFQATFLILARNAACVRRRQALPAWLHGVARRVALKALSAKARRFRAARPLAGAAADPHPDPASELSARELLAIVDEEIQRLPEVCRLPVILCCLEGHSLEEAARRLGWTRGSVKGHLERGRARLHQRLVRRGLTLSAALAAAEVSRSTVTAALVARLGMATTQAAAFAYRPTAASPISAGAAALAVEVVWRMALAQMKLGAVLLATGLVASGLLMFKAAPETPPSQPAQPRQAGFPQPEAPLAQAVPANQAGNISVSNSIFNGNLAQGGAGPAASP